LAAARVKILTIEQISSRLDDRFQLLTSASQAAPPRHQTLRAVLDWSYTLLDEREQRLFRSLGVFSGGWDLDAAESVCAAGDKLEKSEILGLLASLVNKSLVERERDANKKSRYRMLETVRQYAHEALVGTGEVLEVQKRHLDYYLHLAQAPKPHLGFFQTDSQTLQWLQVLSLEHANLRAAQVFCQNHPAHTTEGLKMAGVLHWYFLAQNHLAEGLVWIKKLQAQGTSIPAPVQAQAYLTAGFLACWLGDFATAFPYLETSLNLYAGLENLAGVAFSQHGLGFTANGLGQHAQAGMWFEQCLTIARQIDDQWLISIALHFIAIRTSFQGNYEQARLQFVESIKYMKQGKGTFQGLAFSEFHLGRISRIQGDLSSSYAHHVEGLKIFAQMGDRRGLVYSFFGFSCLAQSQGQLQRAAQLFGALDSIRERLGTLLEAVLEAEYGQVKTATQEALGKDRFQAAWSDGLGMSLERAIQFALNPG
jgi:tetratricopeptide (TPR) repeat protein